MDAAPELIAQTRFTPAAADIEAERVRLLFKQATPTLFLSLGVAGVLAAVLWSVTDRFWLLAWLGVLASVTLLRVSMVAAFTRRQPLRCRYWESLFVAGTAVGGLAWGAAGVLPQVTDSRVHELFIVLTLAGNTAGAIAAYGASYRSYLAFMIPALLPLIVWEWQSDEPMRLGIIGLTTLFACLVAVTALNYHRNLLQSLRMRRENLLLDGEIRLAASVFENSLQGVIITDNDERIVKINPAVTEITGYAAAEAIGKEWSQWLSDEHRAAYHDTVLPALASAGKWDGEAAYRRKNGELLSVWQTVTAALDPGGAALGRIVIFSDNSERKRADDQIRRIAYQDALTGLSNRRVFEDRLGNAIERARRHGFRIGVLFVDLCRFRSINDSLGYQVGDELLRATARRLQQRLRREDTLARLESDKFGVILESIGSAGDAETAARGVIEALGAPLQVGDESLVPACTIGIAITPQDGEDVAALMENADTALNQADKQGENSYCFYSSNMSREASDRLAMEWALRRAIERNELVLHYQPKYSMARRDVVGMEALVRWQHPERGLVGPGEFIALAEETKLIVPLSRWVLRRALSDWRALNEPGTEPLRLSVNVSAQQFPQPDFVASVAAALQESGVPPGQLELEITESVLVGDSAAAAATLRELKALGVRIAIDDFGTGYSSLSYLSKLPIDTIKIDRAFIRALDTNTSNQALVRAILQMSHALDLEVVAEGVETEAEAVALQRAGGNVFQGFLFSKALTTELFPYARARTLPLMAAN